MPDDAQEQTPVADPEQGTPAELEQAAQPVAESGGDPVAEGDAGSVAESEVIDWSRPDTVRGILENPSYKGIKDLLEEQRLNGENTGRQRYESEMRRQAVSDEAIGFYAKNVAMEMGVDADDERVKRFVQAFKDPITQQSQVSAARGLIESAKGLLSDEGKQGIDLALEAAGDNLETLHSIGAQLWTGFGDRVKNDTLSTLSLDEVPEGSKLHKEIQSRVEKELEAELKARNIVATRIDPGPRAGSGGGSSPGLTDEQIESMSAAEINANWTEVQEVLRGKAVSVGA